jgi:hypothetical protein
MKMMRWVAQDQVGVILTPSHEAIHGIQHPAFLANVLWVRETNWGIRRVRQGSLYDR